MERDKYLKIYEEMRQDIIEGTYTKGSKLPSKRVLAEAKNVSVITVTHAYELLAEEGYIIPKEKSGYFVAFDEKGGFDMPMAKDSFMARERRVAATRDKSAFSFSIYAKTVRKVLSEYAEEIMETSPSFGTSILREAIARYLLRSRHIKVMPDQIIVGAGAEYLYELILETFGRDAIFGIEYPSYHKIEKVYSAGGASIERLLLTDDGIDSNSLWNSKAEILHVSPYRSFPSNVCASAGKKREYINYSVERTAYIVEDDFESEFSKSRKPEETLFSLDKSERVIYLNSFSETVGSFIRTSYMVVPQSLLEVFNEKVSFHACPVPTPEQYVLANLIENGDFERHINRVRRNSKKNS